MKELIEYAYNAGRFARMIEDYNRDAEALLNELNNSTTESLAPGTIGTLEAKTDRIMRGQITGMHEDVRTSPGTQQEAARDRDERTIF